MEGHRKRLAVLLAVAAALSAVVVTSAIAHSVKSGAGTLNIYGYGPGDDVQENRAKYAAGSSPGRTSTGPPATSTTRSSSRGSRRATCPTSSA